MPNSTSFCRIENRPTTGNARKRRKLSKSRTIALPDQDCRPPGAEQEKERDMPGASLKTVRSAFFRPIGMRREGPGDRPAQCDFSMQSANGSCRPEGALKDRPERESPDGVRGPGKTPRSAARLNMRACATAKAEDRQPCAGFHRRRRTGCRRKARQLRVAARNLAGLPVSRPVLVGLHVAGADALAHVERESRLREPVRQPHDRTLPFATQDR